VPVIVTSADAVAVMQQHLADQQVSVDKVLHSRLDGFGTGRRRRGRALRLQPEEQAFSALPPGRAFGTSSTIGARFMRSPRTSLPRASPPPAATWKRPSRAVATRSRWKTE